MFPESFRGRAEASAKAHPLPRRALELDPRNLSFLKKEIARFSLFD
jgi:hypothetical protein